MYGRRPDVATAGDPAAWFAQGRLRQVEAWTLEYAHVGAALTLHYRYPADWSAVI